MTLRFHRLHWTLPAQTPLVWLVQSIARSISMASPQIWPSPSFGAQVTDG